QRRVGVDETLAGVRQGCCLDGKIALETVLQRSGKSGAAGLEAAFGADRERRGGEETARAAGNAAGGGDAVENRRRGRHFGSASRNNEPARRARAPAHGD